MPIVIKGSAKDVERLLTELQFKLQGPILGKAIAQFMTPVVQRSTEARFASEGDEAVGKWQPLARSTIGIRESLGFGPGPINVRTGEMKESVTDAAHFGIKGTTPTSVRLQYPSTSARGELHEKLMTAQLGKDADDESGGTPARPVLSFTNDDLEQLLLRTSAWLVESLV